MDVWVLHDDKGTVYAVVTDEESADQWLLLDGSFGCTQCEVDDYTIYNAVSDAVEEESQ